MLDSQDRVQSILIRALDVTAANQGITQVVGGAINRLGGGNSNDGQPAGHLSGSPGLVARSVVPQPEVEHQLSELLGM